MVDIPHWVGEDITGGLVKRFLVCHLILDYGGTTKAVPHLESISMAGDRDTSESKDQFAFSLGCSPRHT